MFQVELEFVLSPDDPNYLLFLAQLDSMKLLLVHESLLGYDYLR